MSIPHRSATQGDWPDLDALPGVAEAVAAVRSAIASVQRLPVNRRGWPQTAAAAGVRAARASSMLDGGSATLGRGSADPSAAGQQGGEPLGRQEPDMDADPGTADVQRIPAGRVDDPVLAGALRAQAAIAELTPVWRRAPLQALARLHLLAAADLAGDGALGRPRAADGVADRLTVLARASTTAPWSGPVLAAVVHGDLAALRPFGTADGVVARAAGRLVMVATGLDPQALTVPEVGFLRAGQGYRAALDAFRNGTPEGITEWILAVCEAMTVGAKEAKSISRAAGASYASSQATATGRSVAGEADAPRHTRRTERRRPVEGAPSDAG